MLETIPESQETVILESFLAMLKAPDGDFAALGTLSQTLNDATTLQNLVAFLSRMPQGKQAFVDRPRLGHVDLQQLHQLPKPTLGYQYADHMIKNGLTPLAVKAIANEPTEFLGAHLGETHDIWHVVTGSDTDMLGEIQLEAFYTAQLVYDRLFLALLAKNLLKAAVYNVDRCESMMTALTQGWRMGKQAKPLFGMQWNRLWETPLDNVRSSLDLTLS